MKAETITSEDVQETKKVLATPPVRQFAKEKGVLRLFLFFYLATIFYHYASFC